MNKDRKLHFGFGPSCAGCPFNTILHQGCPAINGNGIVDRLFIIQANHHNQPPPDPQPIKSLTTNNFSDQT